MQRRWRALDFRFASPSAAVIATSSPHLFPSPASEPGREGVADQRRYGTGAWKGKRVERGEMAAKTALARRDLRGRGGISGTPWARWAADAHHDPGNRVRTRLCAGGSEIQTLGPPAITTIVFRLNFPVRLRFRERPSRPKSLSLSHTVPMRRRGFHTDVAVTGEATTKSGPPRRLAASNLTSALTVSCGAG